mmetsp:Transcript_24685/g.50543  ORF Transcript_24685/g.50543 Transcript_24685/m.50543 type:complete len:212 (+) Transcript_24685:234-869(+)
MPSYSDAHSPQGWIWCSICPRLMWTGCKATWPSTRPLLPSSASAPHFRTSAVPPPWPHRPRQKTRCWYKRTASAAGEPRVWSPGWQRRPGWREKARAGGLRSSSPAVLSPPRRCMTPPPSGMGSSQRSPRRRGPLTASSSENAAFIFAVVGLRPMLRSSGLHEESEAQSVTKTWCWHNSFVVGCAYLPRAVPLVQTPRERARRPAPDQGVP